MTTTDASAAFTADDLAVLPQEHWPFYASDEVDAVTEVLRSGKVNQWTGTKVVAFQEAYDDYLGSGRSIALANGSVALELALRAWGIGPGDEVVVTPRTFVASASCVRLVGATPVFADVDRDSGNVTTETIRAVVTPRTKAIIPVHLAGWPCDMPGIMELAREYDLKVLEDCAQAHGAEIGGRKIGTFGDAAAFSFCQDKIITTGGEGGLTSFQHDADFEWAWSFKDHGKNRAKITAPAPGQGFRYLHDAIGTNWRMLETSAAIGLLQLAKLPAWRAARAERADIWREHVGAVEGLRAPVPSEAGTVHAEYKWYCYVEAADGDLDRAQQQRDEILRRASERGIRAFSGSGSEEYREGAFADLHVAPLPVAHELGRTSLMFEVHPTLDLDRLRRRAAVVAEIAREVLGA
ncbi:MAG: DegT/DnrJ/EryC1/StrS aminotransferase family protein [Thermoleophilia bacterium]|nr:DegT/DnrJ/EryC1/StrS aminotransferase family protein [Thermoleophilia bacterium]